MLFDIHEYIRAQEELDVEHSISCAVWDFGCC